MQWFPTCIKLYLLVISWMQWLLLAPLLDRWWFWRPSISAKYWKSEENSSHTWSGTIYVELMVLTDINLIIVVSECQLLFTMSSDSGSSFVSMIIIYSNTCPILPREIDNGMTSQLHWILILKYLMTLKYLMVKSQGKCKFDIFSSLQFGSVEPNMCYLIFTRTNDIKGHSWY